MSIKEVQMPLAAWVRWICRGCWLQDEFFNLLNVSVFTAKGSCLCTYVCSVALLWWMAISQVSSSFSLIEGRGGGNGANVLHIWGVVFFGRACRKKMQVSRTAGRLIYSRFIQPILDLSHFRNQLYEVPPYALGFSFCQWLRLHVWSYTNYAQQPINV